MARSFPPSPPAHPASILLNEGIGRCSSLVKPLSSVIYRASSVGRANRRDLITGVGSKMTGGRWTPPGAFCAVYASLNEITALNEFRQQDLRAGVPAWASLPLVLTALQVDLQRLLDLTDGRVRRTLRVSLDQMLTEPWWSLQNINKEALTQAIGRLARDHDFEGLIAPSAARRQEANIVIFPDRLARPDQLSIVNADRLPPPV